MIEIEVYYHSDETLNLKNAGVDYSVLECDSRLMTFYNISAIAPYFDEKSEEWVCEIFVGERSFIAVKSYEEIKKKIENQKGST